MVNLFAGYIWLWSLFSSRELFGHGPDLRRLSRQGREVRRAPWGPDVEVPLPIYYLCPVRYLLALSASQGGKVIVDDGLDLEVGEDLGFAYRMNLPINTPVSGL